nr:hypothetical protein [Tanacetum cinerariifolium]
MDLLQNLLDTCTTLTRRVEQLEKDKIAQALEITKLKQRVKKLERGNKLKVLKLRRLKKVGTAQRINTLDDTVMDDVSKQGGIIANIDADEDVVLEDPKDVANEEESDPDELQEVLDVVTTAKMITKVVTPASDTTTAASTTITTADAPIPTATIIAAPLRLTAAPRRRKGVVIRDPEETTTPSTIIHSESKSKDKGKGILEEESDPDELQEVLDVVTTAKMITEVVTPASDTTTAASTTITTADAPIPAATIIAAPLRLTAAPRRRKGVVIDHVHKKAKEDNVVKSYQALKKKPRTEAQDRKNMMIYLMNVAGFKMDYFKGMSYDDISKRQKLDEEVEELRRHLQIVPNDEDDVYTKATPLALKVPVVDYEIYNEHYKPYYKIKRADGSHQLYLSFLSMLRNFDREELEALRGLVKERFAITKPKKFSDDFLLATLRAMFEKLDVQA